MAKKFSMERKHEITEAEKVFETSLIENGFIIKGFIDYQTNVMYLISKDGVEIKYPFEKLASGKDNYKIFQLTWRTANISTTITRDEYVKTLNNNLTEIFG